MTDILRISALRVLTKIGVYEWEQRILQPLLLDISIPLDLSTCNDVLSNTIDYSKLCSLVTTFVESRPFQLIETVAESVAVLIINEFQVPQISVCVNKPHAVKNAGNISVAITR